MKQNKIIILDFASQYAQNIARTIREFRVYCEIHPSTLSLQAIEDLQPAGIILCAGGIHEIRSEILDMGIPVLALDYKLSDADFYRTKITVENSCKLFRNLDSELRVSIARDREITYIPEGFTPIAFTIKLEKAALRHRKKAIYSMLFNPGGNLDRILQNFVLKICACKQDWTAENFIASEIKRIGQRVGKGQVICALSGGVDSSVVALLLHKAIGERLSCVFVNHGLLRLNEAEQVQKVFKERFKMRLEYVDAEQRFLSALEGVSDPEKKRKIIGNLFIEIFEETAEKLGKFDFLAQGTLYTDVLESGSAETGSGKIKSHHNVGGLPEKMRFELLEPLRQLFKDEVREVGRELGLDEDLLMRHPFPGPGLAVRIPGVVTKERCDILRKADYIALEELRKSGYYHKVWQAFCVLLPLQSVGVREGSRSYEYALAFRAVLSRDGSRAEWAPIPHSILARISTRILKEVPGINRVLYDISNKPPATIEWE